MKKLLKNWKFWVGFVIVVIVLVLIFRGKNTESIQTVQASTESLRQVVSISGTIQPTEAVDLSFETGGKISYIGARVGDRVVKGRVLMSLSAGDFAAQVQRERANVAAAQIRLDQLLEGTREVERDVLQTTVEGAQATLDDVRGKVSRDSAQTAFQQGVNAMVTTTTLQYAYFNNNTTEAFSVAEKKEIAMYLMYGVHDLGRTQSWYFLTLNTGLKQRLQNWVDNPANDTPEQILPLIQDMLRAEVRTLDTFLAYADSANVSATDRATATSTQSALLAQITALSNQLQAITSARNSLANAKAQLDLKDAPASSFEVDLARQQLESARAGLAYAQAQLAKRSIVSPITGIVTARNGELGEMINPSGVAVSVMGTVKNEIQAFVPEADIASVAVGNKATITVDAYGRDQIWEAEVVKIYPAAVIIEGVPTYKTIFQFPTFDERLRSGMSADIDIVTAEADSVVAIPQRAVTRKEGGKKYVRVLVSDEIPTDRFANILPIETMESGKIFEVQVETGIRGTNGLVEITSGIQLGDVVVTN